MAGGPEDAEAAGSAERSPAPRPPLVAFGADPGGPRAGQIVFEGAGGDAETPYAWTHLKRSAQTEAALHADATIPEGVAEALLERATLPRVLTVEGHTVLILRGINHGPSNDPEDMISLRLAITASRIVSVEIRRLRLIDRMIGDFREGRAPKSTARFVSRLVQTLRSEAEPVLEALERQVAMIEAALSRSGALDAGQRRALAETRQDAIQLHRYIAPQGKALETLSHLGPKWLPDKRRLKAEAHAFNRIAADLEALLARAQIVAEEATHAVTERTNRIMLTLSAVSVVFLPVTALTGLLGVNLAGIPYAESPSAFWVFAALVIGAAGFAAWLAIRLLR